MAKTLLIALAALSAAAQTRIDLRTQAKQVDFTEAASTKPVKMGTVLPAACSVGELFFKTNAPAGANLYGCAATDTWKPQGGISSDNCWYDPIDKTLKCGDGNGGVYAAVKTAAGGAVNEWVDYIDAAGVPHTSQPTAAAVGAVADPGANGVPYRSGVGAAVPANADRMSAPFSCQDTGSPNAYACTLAPAVAAYIPGTTYWFRAATANTGAATINLNSLGPRLILKESDQPLAPGDIKAGQWVMVTYDGAKMQMQSQTGNPQVTGVSTIFGRSGAVGAQSGDYTTAQVVEGENLYFTNARARAALAGSGPITFNTSAGIFGCPGCITSTSAADTDLYGDFPHLSVVRIQGRPVAATPPLNLQYLGWNNLTGKWEPKNLPDSPVASVFGRTGAITTAAGDYTTAQVTESGSLYFTNARARAAVAGGGPITFNSNTGIFDCPNCITSSTASDTDLSGSFPHLSVVRLQGRTLANTPPADLQYLGWNGSANRWEPKALPAPLVSSVMNRSGAVTAQPGDYSFSQISGAASAEQLPGVAMRTDRDNVVTAGTQDFGGAAHTRPIKTGTAANMPLTCSPGEAYFETDAPAGSNVYGCVATNVWKAQGSLTVKSDDAAVGESGTLNLMAGAGLMTVMTADAGQVNVQLALDTAVVQTQPGEQSGESLLCSSAGSSGNHYACGLIPPLATYASGMVLHWIPGANGTGGATTLNVDTLGAQPVKLADGASDPGPADVIAGRLYDIWYDGQAFRLTRTLNNGGGLADPGTNGILYRSATAVTRVANADDVGTSLSCVDQGSTNNYACNLSPALTTYTAGSTYWFRANSGNTGPATVNLNSLGAKSIKKLANLDLGAGDIAAGQWVMLTYDGSNMQMQSQTASPPAVGSVIAHAATHKHGGNDEVATAAPAANAIPKAGADGKLAQGWLDFSGYQTALGYTPENAAKKGAANGYAPLDSSGRVPAANLPTASGGTASYALTFGAGCETGTCAADPGDGLTLVWTCGSGPGAQCTANWTVPSGVNAINVEMWSGGLGGNGSYSGSPSWPGGGGGGGGYARRVCKVMPGTALTIAVGLGGPGGTGASPGSSGGDSSVSPCLTVYGGKTNNNLGTSSRPGTVAPLAIFSGPYATSGGGLVMIANPCLGIAAAATPGYSATRETDGGCGGMGGTNSAIAGAVGGAAIGGGGGGGGGANNYASGGVGGISVLGGVGGCGGGWTVAGGVAWCGTPHGSGTGGCMDGVIPGGGGGGAAATSNGNGNLSGCSGARGEVRVYYAK